MRKQKMDPAVKPREDNSLAMSSWPQGVSLVRQSNIAGSRLSERQKWLNRLTQVECPNITYIGDGFPTVFKKGNGIYVTDIENKKYLDFTASFGVLALGHRSPTTLRAIKKQSARLIHGMGDVHPSESKIKLLELLAEITPFTNPKSMLGLSGGDAVEIAMKTAVLATGRSKFISFSAGYHGTQLAPLHLNHTKTFIHGFESLLTNHAVQLPFPYFEENGPKVNSEITVDPHDVLNMLEDKLRSKLYAGLVLEPIQGRGGVRIFTKDFLQQCKNLCEKYGTLLVFDEIMTGFGRTGTMFGYELTGVVPHLMCLGKAMGGGFPLSACIGDIMDVWGPSSGEARHTQTYLGHPLACAVGYETILHIKKNLPLFAEELPKLEKTFDLFIKKLNEEHSKEHACFVRGMGFLRGLWFYHQDKTFGPKFMENLYSKNILTLPEGENANVIALMPPLNTHSKHYQKMLLTVLNVLRA